jgi:hypothetical protein
MLYPVPQAAITFSADAGLFGFSVWMPGRRSHYVMETFRTEHAARNWLDPLNERIWEEAPPEAGNVISVSRGYRPDSIPARMGIS